MADLTRWRLFIDRGRQIWKFMSDADPSSQSTVEKYLLGLDSELLTFPRATTPREAARQGAEVLRQLQSEDGHWANDYGGPMFLTPGIVFASYITGFDLGDERRLQLVRYLGNQQHADGGWGLHIDGESTVFGTVLNYVMARLLGVETDSKMASGARQFLRKHGGAIGVPSWGKFWLFLLNLYPRDGLNALPPELWLLPRWCPFHPGKMWNHARMIYLPMGYLFAMNRPMPLNDLLRSIRQEIYVEDYDKIDWSQHRFTCAAIDSKTKPTMVLKLAFGALRIYERFHSSWIRSYALDECRQMLTVEDDSTNFVCVASVNKPLNTICEFFTHGNSERFKKHVDRIFDYLWLGRDGMKTQGYNGSQFWDTCFHMQAIVHAGLAEDYKETLQRAHHYLDISQVREDVPNCTRYWRHISKGAFPFSTRDHGWPVTDNTAEGLRTTLMFRQFGWIKPLEDQRLFDTVNVILSLQNPYGHPFSVSFSFRE
eukprot:TRINITY_DN3479_c0_g1_i5.p1 TRINITY_DN3479_c0_g1~~TRINITY_DN3479_c0_g1_i5.p1  ORF type:complete len:484 (-),score=86.46 TRINITY_DN3479_c0_g1_i5:131-1582(-)